mgnify:CR=1 FL=1
MRRGQSDLGSKRPRYHPVIAWEANNLTNDFIDINRVALDDRYGKVGASLYKRRNGSGPTDGSTPGLFGMSGLATYDSKNSAFFGGIVLAATSYVIADWYLIKGYQLTGLKRTVARWPITAATLLVGYYLFAPNA